MNSSLKPKPPQPRARRIVRSTLTVMIAFALAKVISLVQTLIIARAFGIGRDYDAFVAANHIPELIVILISGGALTHAFIPVFSGFLAKGDLESALESVQQPDQCDILCRAFEQHCCIPARALAREGVCRARI